MKLIGQLQIYELLVEFTRHVPLFLQGFDAQGSMAFV